MLIKQLNQKKLAEVVKVTMKRSQKPLKKEKAISGGDYGEKVMII